MSSKEELVAYLKQQTDYVTVKQAAFDLGVTPRTIQNYLRQLRDENSSSIISSRQGIRLKADALTSSNYQSRPQNYEERKKWMIRKGLLDGNRLYLDKVADYLAISYTTLLTEINRMRKELGEDKIRIHIHGDEMTFAGSNYNKKRYISKMIYQETGAAILNIETLNEMFPAYDAEEITKIVKHQLKEAECYMEENSQMNLVLHILIALNTHTDKENLDDITEPLESRGDNEYFINLTETICREVNKLYPGSYFTNDEKYQYYILLVTRVIQQNDESSQDIIQLTDYRTAELLEKITAKVKDVYQLDLNTPNFMIGFALHLHNLLIRLDSNVRLHNPMLQKIKIESPFIYDIAVTITNVINQETGKKLNDDEISYIALHIGARLEDIRIREERLNTVIVCPDYYTIVSRHIREIGKLFANDIYVSEIIQNPEDLDSRGVDLVFSTVPLPGCSIAVEISPYVNSEDKRKMQDAIYNATLRKQRLKGQALMTRLFNRELFENNVVYKNKEEAMRDMCMKLVRAKYVAGDYLEKIKEREAISPTNFGRIAIPHPTDYFSSCTVIEVALLKKPITWNSSSVNMIFMIALSQEDYPEFQNIFSFLTQICMNPNSLEQLLTSQNYDEFIEILMNLYEKTA